MTKDEGRMPNDEGMTKPEFRIPKPEGSPKPEIRMADRSGIVVRWHAWVFRISKFGIPSDFDIRVSDFFRPSQRS